LPKEDFGAPSAEEKTRTETMETPETAEGILLGMLTISVPKAEPLKIPLTNLHRKLVLGRDPRCEVPLSDQVVSRLHAMIKRDGDRFFVEDLDSKNGTFLNGKILRSGKSTKLSHGDEIRIGRTLVLFESKLAPPGPKKETPPSLISTGYPPLDEALAGGLPVRYSVLLLSPSCDERDLMVRKILASACADLKQAYYLSCDFARASEFASRAHKDVHVLSPHAERLKAYHSRVFEIPGIENLSELNISLADILERIISHEKEDRLMVIDILSDVLLRYKAANTHRWLSEFIAKRKTQQFTLLAMLNPLIVSEADVQTISESFDGILSIYERDVKGIPKRFLVVRKMSGVKYLAAELLLDREQLF